MLAFIRNKYKKENREDLKRKHLILEIVSLLKNR